MSERSERWGRAWVAAIELAGAVERGEVQWSDPTAESEVTMSDAIETLTKMLGAQAIAYISDGQPWTCRQVRPESIRGHLVQFHNVDPAADADAADLIEKHRLVHLMAPKHAVEHTHKEGT